LMRLMSRCQPPHHHNHHHHHHHFMLVCCKHRPCSTCSSTPTKCALPAGSPGRKPSTPRWAAGLAGCTASLTVYQHAGCALKNSLPALVVMMMVDDGLVVNWYLQPLVMLLLLLSYVCSWHAGEPELLLSPHQLAGNNSFARMMRCGGCRCTGSLHSRCVPDYALNSPTADCTNSRGLRCWEQVQARR
jgi:hypothetical protein